MNEATLLFGKECPFVGVLTEPDLPQNDDLAVILLNAGLTHHVGPNRLYVRLARHLAKLGVPVFRFDLSGVGDSGVRTDNLPLEQRFIADARAAMDTLAESRGMKRFILMGHCSGAIQSFMVALADDRVHGAVLMNPEGAQRGWQDYDRRRKLQQYYQNYYGKQALGDTSRWRKLLTGKADYGSVLKNVLKNVLWNKVTTLAFKARSRVKGYVAKPDPMQAQVIEGLKQLGSRQTPILFIYSAGSSGFEMLKAMLGKQYTSLINHHQIRLMTIDGADHIFTLRRTQDAVLEQIANWCAPLIRSAGQPEVSRPLSADVRSA